ncbi:MAG TPA: DUF58 domain-containing protein [Dehalococcoidia bacterium]|nr:DUF58 domain-containing protein [Dehalococcoidia bacterium]
MITASRRALRRYRSLLIVCAILVASLVPAFSTGFWLPFRLAYVIALALPLCYLWARLSLFGVHAEIERAADRLQQGQALGERVSISNRSLLSKLWLEVDEPSDLPGHAIRRVISLQPRQRRSWKAVSTCERRGMYTLGRVTVTSGDPFGLFRFSKSFGHSQTVLVYPRPVELTGVRLPPAELLGEGVLHRPTHYVTSNAVSVRQYAFGDSYNRIHWPSTARTRELMVKLFEMDPASDVWIVMDLEANAQAGSGDESTEEYAVTLAASIANHFCHSSRSIGLLAFGEALQLVQPERGIGQYIRILESLAVMRASGDVSLAQLLSEEGKRFGRHSTVVVITPSTQEDWVLGLQVAAERGAKLAAVLIEPNTFGGGRDSLVVFGALTAAGIHTSVVKRSGDIGTALGSAPSAGQAPAFSVGG